MLDHARVQPRFLEEGDPAGRREVSTLPTREHRIGSDEAEQTDGVGRRLSREPVPGGQPKLEEVVLRSRLCPDELCKQRRIAGDDALRYLRRSRRQLRRSFRFFPFHSTWHLMPKRTRREWLCLVGAGGVAGLAGCSSSDDSSLTHGSGDSHRRFRCHTFDRRARREMCARSSVSNHGRRGTTLLSHIESVTNRLARAGPSVSCCPTVSATVARRPARKLKFQTQRGSSGTPSRLGLCPH